MAAVAAGGQVIRARRANRDTYAFDTDLLSVMLRARDDWGEGMLERHLRDEVVSLYLAGHSTTSELLAWVLYVLARWPQAEGALHAELDALLGDREPGPEDLERLPFTGLVIQEALRLYPPVPILTRDARPADVVEGYRVPPGALVVVSPYVTQRHPEVWPEPDRFDPWRHAPERAAGRHRFALSHSCIGASFAQQEVRPAVASIARHYRLSLLPGPPIEPSVTSTTTPRGLRMRLERRS